MYTLQLLAFGLAIAAPLASAHGLVTAASGDLGGAGIGLGATSKNDQSESDVTVFKSSAGVFGATGAGGNVVLATALDAQVKVTGATLPQVSANGGVVTMNYHQINADGAGPMTCSVSTDATGKAFTPMKITTNVPGTNGRSNAADRNFSLVAEMPAGAACTGTVGTQKNVCVVKCENPVGPFGSNVLVQQGAAKAGAKAGAKGEKTERGGTLAARAMQGAML